MLQARALVKRVRCRRCCANASFTERCVQVEVVGQSVDDLEARLFRVHRASLKYRDALQTLCATQSEFGTALLECRCPGSDDNAIKGAFTVLVLC